MDLHKIFDVFPSPGIKPAGNKNRRQKTQSQKKRKTCKAEIRGIFFRNPKHEEQSFQKKEGDRKMNEDRMPVKNAFVTFHDSPH